MQLSVGMHHDECGYEYDTFLSFQSKTKICKNFNMVVDMKKISAQILTDPVDLAWFK